MTDSFNHNRQTGVALAEYLGLRTLKEEGHDLTGPCIACKSSDAFSIHQEKGIAYCHSCGGTWSPFDVAEQVLGDREQAKREHNILAAFCTVWPSRFVLRHCQRSSKRAMVLTCVTF